MSRPVRPLLALLATLLLPVRAAAQNQEPAIVEANYVIDAAIIAGAFGGGLLYSLLEVDIERRLPSEIFGFDQELRGQFSASAHAASNTLIFANVMLPVAIHVASLGVNEELAQVALVYTESLALSYFLNAASKHLVQRPRPYVYSDDPFVQKYAQEQGVDTHLSFYSGHSAMAFTAAVAGSYLYSLRSEDNNARALVWGLNLAMASATANLRVRAGKHFYSDVFFGMLVGAALGLLVPILHQPTDSFGYEPSLTEYVAIGTGFVAGALISELAPMSRDVVVPLEVAPGKAGDETTIELRLDLLRLFPALGGA